MTTGEYLDTKETNQRRELAHGMVREAPAPFYSHQRILLHIARLMADHVEAHRLGIVAIAPIDVVLDRERALILQPDVLFVSAERLSIIRNQIWGPPDLVVEIFSPGTENWDKRDKFAWYRQYGVREYWLVDPDREEIVVVDFAAFPPVRRAAAGSARIASTVLPALDASAGAVFA